jgi:hypothetical protein
VLNLIGSTPYATIQHVGIRAFREHFGMLATWRVGSSPHHADFCGVPWAMDNFAFSGFDPTRFAACLGAWREFAPTCLWVAAPDVVGDAAATWARFAVWERTITEAGYPLALVAQDGLENMPIAWDCFDALFIGGSTEWKLSDTAALIVREAKGRGKWVHMGRVNSIKRLNYATALGCDSIDGSGYSAFRDKAKTHLPALEYPTQGLWRF